MDQRPVVVYVKHRSPRSWRAKRLLRRKCYAFEVVEVSNESDLPASPAEAASSRTVPQIFVDGRLVGGFDVIRALDRAGQLDRLVRGEV